MSFSQVLILGAIAGLTIFLGLPVAALNRVSAKTKSVLTGVATGILLFLTVEILSKVLQAGEHALVGATQGQLTGGYAVLTLILLVVGLLGGLLGIPLIERGIVKPLAARKSLKKDTEQSGPSPASLSLAIAAGIGLHNFGEGLAIGQSAASGAISLAVLLIVGFGLHNMTEGFGVAAPLTGNPGQSTT